MSSNTVISVNHVSKIYRLYEKPSDRLWQILWGRGRSYYKKFVALSDIDFSLHKGEVLGVVGVNGAGKSTLLQLIAGTIQPTHGALTSHGRVAALLELGSGFNPEFTGRENIFLNAATLGLGKREIERKIDEIIDFAGIGDHIDQPVKTYSSGMYIRLAFSIATSVDPDVLIIDEALSVGDGAFARRSFDRIMKIKERGATVLFCSHTLFHVEVFCDRALWLHQGKMQQFGPVSQVLSRYQEFLDSMSDSPKQLTASDDSAVSPLPEPVGGVVQSGSATVAKLNGHARIESVSVTVDGSEGQELFGLAGESTLKMRIQFLSDPSQPCPSAAIVLSSEGGRILATHISSSQNIVFDRDEFGTGVAEVTLDKIPLNKGRFRVGAYLMCERGIHVYQWIDPAAYIQLHHDGHEQGYFLLDGLWKSESSVVRD